MERLTFPFPFRGGSSLQTSFFLAGGSTDWRQKLTDSMTSDQFYHAIVVDPFDKNYKPEVNTAWEFKSMQKVDCVVFWFPKESLYPISLFELGVVCRDSLKGLIVGMDLEYAKREIIIEQLKLFRPDVNVVSSLPEVMGQMEKFVESYNDVSYDTDYILDIEKIGGTD